MSVQADVKNYCETHRPISEFNEFGDYVITIYSYNDDSTAYVTETYGTTKKYRKVRTGCNVRNNKLFIILDNKRYYLDQFTSITDA